MNFARKGEAILRRVANHERTINYNSLFVHTGNPFIDNFDFLKRFGTGHDILIDLSSKKTIINEAKQEQEELVKKLKELRNSASSKTKMLQRKKQRVASRKQSIKYREIIFFA